ncbi:MAG TPA: hypothetical protein VFB83_05270 [Propionibacteriaceae bacterium]|jgi:hypothetical protein|nr:hypothetical protein [Propionibacteriaceae bacterium]
MPVTKSRRARHLVAAVTGLALASAVAVATAAPASAAPASHGRPDFTLPVLPAGQACAGFDVLLAGTGDKRAIKQHDNGVLIEAGNGWDLTFTNLSNGHSITLLSNGSVNKSRTTDNITTFQATGKNVLILFPTDVPAGPTSTLYTGRLVYTVDNTTGVFTVVSSSGRTTDLCALVA